MEATIGRQLPAILQYCCRTAVLENRDVARTTLAEVRAWRLPWMVCKQLGIRSLAGTLLGERPSRRRWFDHFDDCLFGQQAPDSGVAEAPVCGCGYVGGRACLQLQEAKCTVPHGAVLATYLLQATQTAARVRCAQSDRAFVEHCVRGDKTNVREDVAIN